MTTRTGRQSARRLAAAGAALALALGGVAACGTDDEAGPGATDPSPTDTGTDAGTGPGDDATGGAGPESGPGQELPDAPGSGVDPDTGIGSEGDENSLDGDTSTGGTGSGS